MAGDAKAASGLRAAGHLLGLLQLTPAAWFQGEANDEGAEIEMLIAQRLAARKAKDFAASDKIRNDLAARGIVLEDNAAGTTWRRA
jgi:cysteinyl-tRNA synthetase